MDNVTNYTELGEAFDEFMQAFEAFKQTNDERLEQVEKRMAADIITSEKLERINRAMDEHKRAVDTLTLKSRRPALGAQERGLSARALEHRSAWNEYMRKGDSRHLQALEAKALSAGTDADGGYTVPEETESRIGKLLSQASPIRAIAGIRQISAATYKKPFATSGFSTGWVGETASRPQTSTPTLAELSFPAMELYAMPAATPSLLEDSAVDIEQWIAEEVQSAFAEQEGAAFVNGDGSSKPRGFLDYTKVADSAWSWGNLGYVVSGASGAFAATDPSDALIDLIYAVKSGYRANAHFVMNRATQSEIRKLKDADGNYLWQPPVQAGAGATLMNVPIAEAEDMPDISADSFSIAFGDFGRGYLIVDRVGVRVLRDPFSSKPYVLFYTTKRVGGGVQNFEAIKLMKFATS
ncbi:MAG TPA: phage major capsid protein [Rhizobiales bacterium]|nr:phage major capsid protein [Hyphomicrobiales bacterium]